MRSSEECSAYSGPSWTTSSGSNASASTPFADQTKPPTSARRSRERIESGSIVPAGASSSSSQTGRSYPSSSSTERSPNGALARSGFSGSTTVSVVPFVALHLELVLEPREPVRTRDAQLPRPRPAALAELERRARA